MGVRQAIRHKAGSFAENARLARWHMLLAEYPGVKDWRVLDLGGTIDSWLKAPVQPRHVTVVNLLNMPEAAGFTTLRGDACEATKLLQAGGLPLEYDMVYSNSLIEHVGGHAQRQKLANEVRGLAPHYWVQTPYRYFPVEPHWLFPGAQFLPVALQAQVLKRWPLIDNSADIPSAVGRAADIELMSITQMRSYFPEARLLKEHAGGMTKSLICLH